MSTVKSQKEKLFRLHGDLKGEPAIFVLGHGDNPVGADATNAIQIPVRQVSRRHAVIKVKGDGVHLEDLGSTNGTYLNGVRVRKARLNENDWVQFGPVVLTFESLTSDDHDLAITLDESASSRQRTHANRDRTTEVGIPPHTSIAWAKLLGSCAAKLINRWSPDVQGAIELLSATLGGAAVALVNRDGDGSNLVLAATGDVAGLVSWEDSEKIRRLHDDLTGNAHTSSHFLNDSASATAAVSWNESGWDVALLVAGVEISAGERPFLEVVLRMLQSATVPVPENGRPEPMPDESDLRFPNWHVLGRAPAMLDLYRQLASLSRGNMPVLVTGETGVGKEHVVRILHASSDRADGPLQIVNCTAIPVDLLEAELFGIEAGVATGVTRRQGKLRLAHGGILFLDEIGDMNPALQAKLLRALQEGEVHPLGASAPVTVDVRVVAATNTDLEQRVRDGVFRKDLFYRIAGCEIRVPPLRHRREDIPALCRFFIERAAKENQKAIRGVSISALEALQAAAWPGNVRQLQRELNRLVTVCPPGHTIESAMISPAVLTEVAPEDGVIEGEDLELKRHLESLEKRLIERALDRAADNHSEAARLLGVTRNGLTMKMKRLGVGRD